MTSKDDLLAFSDGVFERTRRRLDGLTDDEYRWEPVPGCWSVRVGTGDVPVADGSYMPDSGPLTTISWRLWHLIGCYGEARNAQWLNGSDGDGAEARCAPRAAAADALAALDTAHDWWRSVLMSLTDADLAAPLGPKAGPYSGDNRAGFVLHMVDEFIHHGAELALMRDLYAASVAAPAMDPVLAALVRGEQPTGVGEAERLRTERPELMAWAAANGFWQAVPVLVSLGFDVNATYNGTTPLHQAAASAPLAIVRLLAENGADTESIDDVFQRPPIGWARYLHRQPTVAYLRSLETSDAASPEHDTPATNARGAGAPGAAASQR